MVVSLVYQAVKISQWQQSCNTLKFVQTDTHTATLSVFCRRPLGFLNDLHWKEISNSQL
jgi:hypothetical protein